MRKNRIEIRIESYSKDNHYSIQFRERRGWLKIWIPYGSCGCNRILNFDLTAEEKFEIVEFLRKYIKLTDIVSEND